MSNPYYNHGGTPATGSTGSSSAMRSEFASVAAGFDKLPVLSGFGNKAIVVNAGGTALTTTAGSLALAGDFSTSGASAIILTSTGATNVTLPTTGTLATLAGSESLSNKTIVAPVFSGSSSGTYTLAGAITITAPAISSPVFSGTATGTYTLAGTPTITAPIFSGTITGTYTLAGTSTITAPTISAPTFSGTASGSLTALALTSAVLTTSTVAANPTTALGVACKQYVDNQASTNPISNGNMEVWQRGTSFTGLPSGGADFTADRYRYDGVGAGVVTVRRSTNVPTVAEAGVLFNYSLEVDVTTADASLAATDVYYLRHVIEGYNWRQFAQRDLTLSFWVMSSKTGTHCVAVRSNGAEYLISEYTVAGADTWEWKTVTLSASPSAGTWNYTNGVGLEVIWALAAGSNFHGTGAAWQAAANKVATSNQVNVLDNVANFFRITGVKLELGSSATPIQFRSFQDELTLCQRYYQKSFAYATAPAQNAGGAANAEDVISPYTGTTGLAFEVALPVRMRAAPTVTTYNTNAANANPYNSTDGADDSSPVATAGERKIHIAFTPNASNTAGDLHYIAWSADAEL